MNNLCFGALVTSVAACLDPGMTVLLLKAIAARLCIFD